MKLLLLIIALVAAAQCLSVREAKEHHANYAKLFNGWKEQMTALRSHHLDMANIRTHARVVVDHLASTTNHQVSRAQPAPRIISPVCRRAIQAVLESPDYPKCLRAASNIFNPTRTTAQRDVDVTAFCTTDRCGAKLGALVKTLSTSCRLSRSDLRLGGNGTKALSAAMWARSVCLKDGTKNCVNTFYDAMKGLNVNGGTLTDANLNAMCGKCTFRVLRSIGNAGPSNLLASTLGVAKKQLRSFCHKRNGEYCIRKMDTLSADVLKAVSAMQVDLNQFLADILANPLNAQGALNKFQAVVRQTVNNILGIMCNPCIKLMIRSLAATGAAGPSFTTGGFGAVCQKDGGEFCLVKLFLDFPSSFFTDSALLSGRTPPCSAGTCDPTCKALVDRYAGAGCCAKSLVDYVAASPATKEKVAAAFNLCDTKLPNCKFSCERNFRINATVSNFRCGLFDALAKTDAGKKLCGEARAAIGSDSPCEAFAATCDAAKKELNFEVKGKFCSDVTLSLADIKDPIDSGETFLQFEQDASPDDLSMEVGVTFRSGGYASVMSLSVFAAFAALIAVLL